MRDDLVDRLHALTTSAVSDALDRLRIVGHCHGLRAVTVDRPIAGPAFTVRFAPISPNSDATVGDYLDDVPAGHIIVLDNNGSTDATVWGDILSLAAIRRGVEGTLIDGVCRDSAAARELGYPIYARGTYMRTGKDRVQVADVNVPVACSTAQVGPGDLLLGDGDGVVVVPRGRAEEIVSLAESIEKSEDSIRQAVLGGRSLREARSEHDYFRLQRDDDRPTVPARSETERP